MRDRERKRERVENDMQYFYLIVKINTRESDEYKKLPQKIAKQFPGQKCN